MLRYLSSLVLLAFAAVGFCLTEHQPVQAASPSARIEQIKAVFLFNFASFVDWPAAAFHGSESPLRYCSTAKGASAKVLREVLAGEKLGQRPIEYRQVDAEDDLSECHVLYLKGVDHVVMQTVLRRLQGLPVLTTSDSIRFAARGGMIELTTRRNRVRPVVNLAAAREAGLRPSSKLLRLSTVINE